MNTVMIYIIVKIMLQFQLQYAMRVKLTGTSKNANLKN